MFLTYPDNLFSGEIETGDTDAERHSHRDKLGQRDIGNKSESRHKEKRYTNEGTLMPPVTRAAGQIQTVLLGSLPSLAVCAQALLCHLLAVALYLLNME